MKWVKVLLNTDVNSSSNFIRSVDAEGKRLCVIKANDEFFATQIKCPHAGADLSDGWCKEGKLICPYHRYSYDLKTGRGDPGQGDYINTYPVELRTDGVYVGLPENRGFLKKLFRL